MLDPGRMGAYFQAPARVAETLRVLHGTSSAELLRFVQQLEASRAAARGLTVAF